MSAPDTNVERQEKRHAPSLLGIRGAMILAALIFLAVALYSVFAPEVNDASADPDPAAAVVVTD